MKILCTTLDALPAALPAGEVAFTFFQRAGRPSVGTIAHGWRNDLRKEGFAPSSNVWDFVQFCLAVCAADFSCERATSADGWTRVIDLTVALHRPLVWSPLKGQVVNPGSRRITASKPGYNPSTVVITVVASEARRVSIDPQRVAQSKVVVERASIAPVVGWATTGVLVRELRPPASSRSTQKRS